MRIKDRSSQSEEDARRILYRAVADSGWYVSRNVSLQQVLDKERDHLPHDEYTLLTTGSLDFLISNERGTPLLAVEIDGWHHDQPAQIRRDLIKNDLCARASLPLLRIRSRELSEREETSVLEWLVNASATTDVEGFWDALDGAFAETARQTDELRDVEVSQEPRGVEDAQDAAPVFEAPSREVLDRLGDADSALGDVGVETIHPFPDNAIVERRLLDQWDVGRGQISPLIAYAGSRYVLALRWPPPFTRVKFEPSAASEDVIAEVDYIVVAATNPERELLRGTGAAGFAWANRVPDQLHAKSSPIPIDAPWDALGVARQLAEFDALRQVEAWAARELGR